MHMLDSKNSTSDFTSEPHKSNKESNIANEQSQDNNVPDKKKPTDEQFDDDIPF